MVRTMHTRLADGLTPDASRGFERGIRAVVVEARQSLGVERESTGHAVPAPVKQQAIQHVVSQERKAPAQELVQGHGLGTG